MNKGIQITKIVIAVIIIIVSISFILSYFNKNDNDNYIGMKVVRDDIISENIDSIDLEWPSGKVDILKSNDNNIRIIEKSTGKSTKSNINVSNNKLSITYKLSSGLIIFNTRNKSYLEIYLPEKEYNELAFDFTSGNYNISDLKTKKLDLEITSGKVDFKNVSTNILDIDATSGKIDFNGSSSDIKLDMTSGKVNVETSIMPKALDIEITSGSANVRLPENNGFEVELEKISGQFNSDFELSQSGNKHIYKNGESKFKVDVSSGKVNILK